MVIKEELIEEMFEDWLWEKYYDEFRTKAINEIEKELGIWKSIFGFKTQQKIRDRQWKIFEEFKKNLINKGKIIYSDLNKPEKSLFSKKYRLIGKPDYIINKNGYYIPI